jgi:hypothetical protein
LSGGTKDGRVPASRRAPARLDVKRGGGMPDQYASTCCGAPVEAAGTVTHYYVCSACRDVCEWTVRAREVNR